MKNTDNQSESKQTLIQNNHLSTSIVDKLANVEKITRFSFTKPVIKPKYIDNYKQWIKNNFNAQMGWMENNIEIRGNLSARFPWAKSVLVFADNFYLEKERKKNTLKISRYAWGDDYHKVLEKKLKNILKNLKIYNPKIEGKIYVDTGPVLEKAFAIESGLGWMGKNSLIIVPELGSYCFLGILIINVEIDQNPKIIESRCGSCTNCLKACPTGALETEYQLNANKCISYFSIEKKDDFTEQESQWLQDWLYGCDICMETCPWNKKWAKTAIDKSYYNRIHLLEKSPKEWQELTEHEFGVLFQKNVFKRLKFDRFRRNLLAAIKNL